MHELSPQYHDREQQETSDTLGMWIFLTTEVMLFGALFLAYTAYRLRYPEAFALGVRRTDMLLGSANTALLLTSSFAMALGVLWARAGARRRVLWCLAATGSLGALFLALKLLEYAHHYAEGLAPGLHFTIAGPHAANLALFFVHYFVMTGLHALHLTIGIGLLTYAALRTWRMAAPPAMLLTLVGLYWHFVDLVWVFLYPLFYLMGRAA